MEIPDFIFQATENLVERPWGGEWISLLKGFRKKGIGESWEFSAHPSNPSQVLLKSGVVKLTELFIQAKKEILGDLSEKYNTFPLLLRLLDVSGRLELRVNPSTKVAEDFGESEAEKQTAWLMLGGTVFIGFSEDIAQENFDEVVGDEKLLFEKLNRFKAEMYDTFMIPAGLVYSAENARIIEISNNSMLSYTLKEEKAKKAIKPKKTEDFEVKGKKGKLETNFFTAEVLDILGGLEFSINTFNILFCLDGYLMLKSEKKVSDLQKGYSCLIPASVKNYSIQSEKAKVLRIVPK